jgi:hypothetical protein
LSLNSETNISPNRRKQPLLNDKQVQEVVKVLIGCEDVLSTANCKTSLTQITQMDLMGNTYIIIGSYNQYLWGSKVQWLICM